MRVSTEDFAWSFERIAEAVVTYHNFNGFTADQCGQCKATANVLSGGPGWFCPCGHYNLLPWHGFQKLHEAPDLGPSESTIQAGFALAEARYPDSETVVWLQRSRALVSA